MGYAGCDFDHCKTAKTRVKPFLATYPEILMDCGKRMPLYGPIKDFAQFRD